MYRLNVIFKTKDAVYWFILILICLCFGTFEFNFIPHEMLAADEFVFARQIYDYTIALPYRDFVPYKTTLGNYLLSIPMWFHQQLDTVFYIKYEITILNIICMLLVSFLSMRFFDQRAILLTLIAIIANQFFLVYATELRVDMLASWFCLISMLFVMQQRLKISGVIYALAFLISQKSLWYFVGINLGLICFQTFPFSIRKLLRSLTMFNGSLVITIIFYCLFWSLLASPSSVYQSLFYDAFIQARIIYYTQIYFACWGNVLGHGPFLFILFPLTIFSLYHLKSIDEILLQRLGILIFATISLIFIALYRQAFPYNFVFTVPAFFLLYSNFITWLLTQIRTGNNLNLTHLTQTFPLTSIIAVYSLGMFLFLNYFSFPIVYNLIVIFPLMLYAYLSSQTKFFYYLCGWGMAVIFLITGILYPIYRVIDIINVVNNDYQYTVLHLMNKLVSKNGDYLAGIPYLLDKDQPIVGLKNLIDLQTDYIHLQTPSLAPLLLESLYLSRTTADKVLTDLNASQIKVIIFNYKILSLPKKITNYFWNNYQHFYGSIFLYAPTIDCQNKQFHLKFSATYRVESENNQIINIDGKLIKRGEMITLSKGQHRTQAKFVYHLALIPDIDTNQLNPAFNANYFFQMIKPISL